MVQLQKLTDKPVSKDLTSLKCPSRSTGGKKAREKRLGEIDNYSCLHSNQICGLKYIEKYIGEA
jgi:hypothetical protein